MIDPSSGSSDSESDFVIENEDILYGSNRDFTKLYNRLKMGVVTGNAPGNVYKEATTTKLTSKVGTRLNASDSGSPVAAAPSEPPSLSGSRKANGVTVQRTDKSDRATTEQVLDPRTRIILLKMLNQNVFYELNGCISTGKEANVYHGVTEDGQHRAVKIYKTSILVFKDRDRYVTGEFRFKSGYSKHNPRKMVKVWAEKEMRNLKRLYNAGIPCPEPFLLRSHVLVMEFIGDRKGMSAPLLKDAEILQEDLITTYLDLMLIMRKIYKECRLVHADFSEYNILYYKKQLFIIDVGQAVEHDHPNALEFLRKDCLNVHDFFVRKGMKVLSIKDMFDFITSDIAQHTKEEMIEWMQERMLDTKPSFDKEFKSDDTVFMKTYIPRNLNEVINVEKEVYKASTEGTNDLVYQNISGVVGREEVIEDESESETEAETDGEETASEAETDNYSDSDSQEDSEDETKLSPEEAKELLKKQRKEHKKLVKEARREKRKTKIPKAVKKRQSKTVNKK